MSSLIMELGHCEILSAEMAVSLRNYIASRNPSLSPDLRAGIFSDAVTRIVESKMPKFSQDTAKRLKELLFRDIAKKPVFSIDCGDVFKAAVGMKALGFEFFRELNGWLSVVLKKEVARESLFEFVVQAHKLMVLKPEDSMGCILESVEHANGGLKFAVQKPESVPAQVLAETAVDVHEEAAVRQHAHMNENNDVKESVIADRDIYELDAAATPKKFLFPTRPRRAVSAPVLAAAALTVMLFIGLKFAADSSPVNTGDAVDPAPVTYLAAPVAGGVIPAEDQPATKAEGIRMRATAYDLSKESCGKSPGHPLYGITSSGTRASVGRTVAVDPEVIPLGSRVSISFPAEYSQLDGIYIAEDTGRLIKGDKIDIFFGEDRAGSREVYESAMKFGVRYVDVKVLD